MSEEREPKRTAKPYHHGDLRNALIEAGRELLIEEGVAGLDLRKVARRAGVSHAAPYRHFADKQALVATLAEDGFLHVAERMRAELAAAPRDVRAQLVGLARAYIGFAIDQPAHMREMFSGLTIERAAYPSLYRASKETLAIMLDVLQSGQASGAIRPGDPIQHAIVVWSSIHGLAMLVIEDQIPEARGNPAVVDQMIEQTIQTLYSGLAQT